MSVCTYQAEVVVSCLLLRCTEIEHRMWESEGGSCASKHVGGYAVYNAEKLHICICTSWSYFAKWIICPWSWIVRIICMCWSLEVVVQSVWSTCICGEETFGHTQEAIRPWGQNSDVWKCARNAVLLVTAVRCILLNWTFCVVVAVAAAASGASSVTWMFVVMLTCCVLKINITTWCNRV